MRTLPIPLEIDRIANCCRRHPITRLSLFGSVLREDFTAESDVDFLVEFVPNSGVGMFELARMESELGSLTGRKVDLRTPLELSEHFRNQVMAEAEVIYAKGD